MEVFNEHKFSAEVLQKRFEAMFQQHYECVGVFEEDRLIGVTGLWYQTRHYSGEAARSIMFISMKNTAAEVLESNSLPLLKCM